VYVLCWVVAGCGGAGARGLNALNVAARAPLHSARRTPRAVVLVVPAENPSPPTTTTAASSSSHGRHLTATPLRVRSVQWKKNSRKSARHFFFYHFRFSVYLCISPSPLLALSHSHSERYFPENEYCSVHRRRHNIVAQYRLLTRVQLFVVVVRRVKSVRTSFGSALGTSRALAAPDIWINRACIIINVSRSGSLTLLIILCPFCRPCKLIHRAARMTSLFIIILIICVYIVISECVWF